MERLIKLSLLSFSFLSRKKSGFIGLPINNVEKEVKLLLASACTEFKFCAMHNPWCICIPLLTHTLLGITDQSVSERLSAFRYPFTKHR